MGWFSLKDTRYPDTPQLQLYNAINTDLDTSFCSFENEMEGRYLILLARFFSCIFFIVQICILIYGFPCRDRGYRINSSRTMSDLSVKLSVLQDFYILTGLDGFSGNAENALVSRFDGEY